MAKLYFIEEGSLVKLLIDSPDQKINSVAGEIELAAGAKFEQVFDANSLISFWVDKPPLRQGSAGQNNKIIFSGIIPGGYQGTGGQILALQINSVMQGSTLKTQNPRSNLKISNPQVLLHDGLGTAIQVETPVFSFIPSEIMELNDNILPEVFRPEISTEASVFAGQKFLVFQTQDKQTGIDHYEVKEGLWGEWLPAESPYLLQQQKFFLKVAVRAVDLAGNAQVVTRFSPTGVYLSLALGAIIVVSLCLWFFKRKKSISPF